MRGSRLKPPDPSLCLQSHGPHQPLEHRQHVLQGRQSCPCSRGKDGRGGVGTGDRAGLSAPEQEVPFCGGDGLSLLLDGGAYEKGEDQPVSLKQSSAHLQHRQGSCRDSKEMDRLQCSVYKLVPV